MDGKTKEALQELLKILSDCPELADRITITIKPNSKPQGTGKSDRLGSGWSRSPLPQIIAINARLSIVERKQDHVKTCKPLRKRLEFLLRYV